MQKYFLIIFLFIAQIAYAENCPTIADLKTNHLNGWSALDINNASPLSKKELERFKKNVAVFAMAEWMRDAPEGSGHCYYNGQQSDDYLGVFLAKQDIIPDPHSTQWTKINTAIMQCTAGIAECSFK